MEISNTKLGDLGTMSGIGPRPSAAAELPSGKEIGERYEIVKVIGRGGMGIVYEAADRLRGTSVALKFLTPELVASDTATQRFLNEARIASDLAHENIVRVYDVSKYDNSYFLSMELLQGQSLRQLLQELAGSGQKMPVAQALGIAKDVAQALAYAHRTTIHRDIKPENIWILPDGKAKLMDFGIARLQSQTQGLTKTATALGTAYYMAPEQLVGSGQIDHRADQYSLGVVLYEMLTGSLPIGRSGVVSKKRADLGKTIDEAVETMLAGSASERFADDEAVLLALRRALAPAKAFSINKAAVFFVTLILVCAFAYGGYLFLGERERVRAEQAAKVERDRANAARQELLKQQARREAEEKAKAAAAEEAQKAFVAEAERKAREAEAQKKLEESRALQIDSASCEIVPAEAPGLQPTYRVKARGKATMAPGKFLMVRAQGNVGIVVETTSKDTSTLTCGAWSVGPVFFGRSCTRGSAEPPTTAWEAAFEVQFKRANWNIDAVAASRRSPGSNDRPIGSDEQTIWRKVKCR